MKGKDLIMGMSALDDMIIQEAETECLKEPRHSIWRWGAAAACVGALLIAAVAVLPQWLPTASLPPSQNNSAGTVHGVWEEEGQSSVPFAIQIDRKGIFVNEITAVSDKSRRYYDPALYHDVYWKQEDVTAYFGREIAPAYIPSGLLASPLNGTATVIADQNGGIQMDSVTLNYYHDYYEDGSPKLTDDVAAVKGFSLEVSRMGILPDCYQYKGEKIKTSEIEGVSVSIGHYSMEYGPYDPQTHEPAGYFGQYVADFSYDGVEYRLVASQLELEEVVKVVASVISGNNEVMLSGGER